MSKFGFKKFFQPFVPPFMEQGDGITPALGDDVRVCPFLPIIRYNQDHRGQWSKGDSGIVIEAGEPLGIATIGGKKYLVPASPVPYKLQYSQLDVGVVEDIDNKLSAVGAAGKSTATIPATEPIGLAHQAVRQSPLLSDSTELYCNWDPTFKEVAVRRRHFTVAYFRKGPKAMGAITEGNLIVVAAPASDGADVILSADHRPVLKAAGIAQANIHAGGAVDANNVSMVIGRAIRVWEGLPANFDLTFVVTPRGSGLAGSDTGGVPQEYYQPGNVPAADAGMLPSDITKAGAVMIAYEF